MIKRLIVIFLLSFYITSVNADGKTQALKKVTKNISSTIGNLMPGEGITEVSLDYNDDDEDQINFSILGVRDINATENYQLIKI